MKNLKYIIISTCLLLVSTHSYSQRIWGNPVGQYAYNPAGAAMNDLGELVSCFYTTYESAINSPQGLMLLGSATFPTDNMGAGFRFTTEAGGVIKNIMGEATFMYRVNLGRDTKLAFGLSAVFNQIGLDYDKLSPQHAQDPIITQGAETGSYIDANFGISIYEANQFYFGIAGYNLIGQQTSWLLPNFTNRASRLISASGMYSLNLFQGDGKLETTLVGMTFMPQDEFTLSYDASCRLILKKTLWFGGGYSNNLVKVLAGIYIQNLSIGYTGAIGMGDISDYTYAFPKHELFLRMELDTSKSSR
jgi:type IX secretion system PorP/SprF family membrane protein